MDRRCILKKYGNVKEDRPPQKGYIFNRRQFDKNKKSNYAPNQRVRETMEREKGPGKSFGFHPHFQTT